MALLCGKCGKRYSESDAQDLNMKCNSKNCEGNLQEMITGFSINEPIDKIKEIDDNRIKILSVGEKTILEF